MAGTDISLEGVLDEEDGEAPTPAKSSRKKLILFALIGLLVIGGGAGASFVFFFGDEPVVEEAELPPPIEKPREIKYINIEPIFVQIESGGTLQNIVVMLALEVEDGSEHVDRIEQEMPRLYEAYLRTLTVRPLPADANGNVEITHIKNRIRAENLRLLGHGAVYDVVLRDIWITEG